MQRLLAALAGALATACAPLPALPACTPGALGTPCHARLVVTAWSEGFTPEEDAALRSGAAMWEAATGGAVQFDWTPDGRVRIHRGRPAADMLGVTENDSITIDAASVAPAVGLAGVAAHELGHALGVPHLRQSDALMFPTVHPCMQVTPADVRALLEHWRARGLP